MSDLISRLEQMPGYINGYDPVHEADQHHAYKVGFADAVRDAASGLTRLQHENDPVDDEFVPHPFTSRTPYEPGDDRDIWCNDCEYHRDHKIHVTAALPRLHQERETWQPIETAPKDKCWFLGWHADLGHIIWRDGPGLITGEDPAPTHWMPLPDPPSSHQERETPQRTTTPVDQAEG